MRRAWFGRSDRLLAGAVLVAVLLVWGVLLGFDLIGAFANEIDEVGEGDYTLAAAALHVLYTVPRRVYELFQTAALIGTLIGLGGLAATSELTALRAAGLSRLRICIGAVLPIAALTLLMMASAETLGPWGEQRSQALALSAKSRDLAVARWSGLWAREGETFLNAQQGRLVGDGGPDSHVQLDQVRLFEFADDGRLASLAVARRAEHRHGEWTLFDVRRTVFHERSASTTTVAQERWESQLQPDLLSQSLRRARYLSTAELSNNIDYMRRNRLDPGEFEVAFWGRFFFPLNVFALCFAAMPFAFGTLRDGGFSKRLFFGIVFGLVWFLLQRVAVDLSTVYRLDPRLGNALPSLAVVLVAWLRFRRQA